MSAAPMLHLHDYPEVLEEIYQEIAEGGGEITPEHEARLDAVHGSVAKKLQSTRDFYINLDESSKALDSYLKRLKQQKAGFEKTKEWVKDYVRRCLLALEVNGHPVERYPLHRGRVRLQPNSQPTITWIGESNRIPKRFRRTVITLDGTLAHEEWKAKGKLPKGFRVVTGKHLRLE